MYTLNQRDGGGSSKAMTSQLKEVMYWLSLHGAFHDTRMWLRGKFLLFFPL